MELLHLGRGHTGGDAVVRVGDADVVFAGDLVEESARGSHGAVPGFGADSYPLEWPATLDLVISLLTTRSVVVPGHGMPVGREFVEQQREAIGIVAETIRDLASRGVGVGGRTRQPLSGPTPATSWRTPYDGATSSCPGARRRCRCCEPL